MLRNIRPALGAAVIAALAASCASEPPQSTFPARNAGGYRVGQPYEIDGVWYYPREQPDYDSVGIASWYGQNYYGRRTADGEIFDGAHMTAAHPTLPLPVNVRVTNLENGRTAILRVNDRGPFVKGRILDVSPVAAEALGFYRAGTARVRVTYLGRADRGYTTPAAATPVVASAPSPAPVRRVAVARVAPPPVRRASTAPRSIVRETREPAPVRMASLSPPPSRPAPPPHRAPRPAPIATAPFARAAQLYVQAGTFAAYTPAAELESRLAAAGGVFISLAERDGAQVYRVRCGPYDDMEAANAALARLAGLGNNGARIVTGP